MDTQKKENAQDGGKEANIDISTVYSFMQSMQNEFHEKFAELSAKFDEKIEALNISLSMKMKDLHSEIQQNQKNHANATTNLIVERAESISQQINNLSKLGNDTNSEMSSNLESSLSYFNIISVCLTLHSRYIHNNQP